MTPISREILPSTLEAGVEKPLTFVKERPRTNKKSSNGLILETRTKYGLLNLSGDYS
jgi:hypothetical protein